MLKTRLVKIENKLLPKEPYPFGCLLYDNGVCEYMGQKFVSKEEFIKTINPQNIFYIGYNIPKSKYYDKNTGIEN